MGYYDDHNQTHLVPHTMPDDSIRNVPIRACITNTKRWDAGETENVNIWHPFPTTAKELQAALDEIGVEPNRRGKYFITGYETHIGNLHDYLPEFVNLNELNYLASKLNMMEDEQRETYGAVVLDGLYTHDMADLIDITENIDSFYLQPAFSLDGYGEFLAETAFNEHWAAVDRLADSDDEKICKIPFFVERLYKHIDTVSFAREVVAQEKGKFTDYGYLTKIADFMPVHISVPLDFHVISDPSRESAQRPSALAKLAELDNDATIKAYIINPDKTVNGEPAGVWHPFPTTKEEIHSALKEIGLDSVRDGEFSISYYETTIDGLVDYLPEEYASLDELNYLAAKIDGLDPCERGIFNVIVAAGDVGEEVEDLINLADCTRCFDYSPGIGDDKGLGHYLAERSGKYDTAAIGNLTDFIDYAKLGKATREDENGIFYNDGYLVQTENVGEVYSGIEDIPDKYRVVVPSQRDPVERPSAIGKLDAAKEAVKAKGADKPHSDKSKVKAHDTDL